MKLIYISNTRIPSEKANTYQSMVMCEALSENCEKVEFWYPNMRNTEAMSKIDDAFEFYGVKKLFNTVKITCFDNDLLFEKYDKAWFITRTLSFSISYIIRLRKIDVNHIVYSRDALGLRILSIAKKYGIIRQKVFFEAHIYSKQISKSCKFIDGLVVINNYLKKLYQEDGVKNILVAHDGVKLETFKVITEQKAKEVLSLSSHVKYITYIGRFNTMGDEKGIPEIIESFKYIDDVNIKLLCVGGPLDGVNRYYQVAKICNIDKNRLIFIDRQAISQLYKYLSASSVLLMPFPWSEHYAYFMSPLKMFEYMASKRPIIASRLPSIEEVLQDKKNAILCEPDNPKDLADKIQWVLNNDCDKIVNQAYEDVQDYTWEKRAKNILRWMKNEK